jgi:ClpP class serine protease
MLILDKRQAQKAGLIDELPTLDDQLATILNAAHVTDYRREYRFAAVMTGGFKRGLRRRLAMAGLKDWRFDFAWPQFQLAVECEGATFVRGRHTRGVGFEEDCRKYNAAELLHWHVLRFTAQMIESGEALTTIERALHVTFGG